MKKKELTAFRGRPAPGRDFDGMGFLVGSGRFESSGKLRELIQGLSSELLLLNPHRQDRHFHSVPAFALGDI
jgi:hypothetical protein